LDTPSYMLSYFLRSSQRHATMFQSYRPEM